jgi:predicted MFS family arabinose efflux permease
MQEVIAPAQPSGKPDRTTFLHAAIFIVVGILATTLAQPQMLGRIPLQNLLKNELHVSRSANAAFFFWIGLAWYFKPFAGIVTDSFPLFGSRRRSYILLAGSLATLLWVVLAFTPHVYGKLLAVAMVLDALMVVASTVVGGYMVEVAQATAGSGRLTSLRQAVMQGCYIINGPTAGFLASIPFMWTAGACGGVMFLIVPATIFFLHERDQRIASRELLGNARKQLVKIGTAKTMWAAAGLMALFYIAPGISTAIFYKQQNELNMNTQAQGMLVLLSGIGGVLASIAYSFLCRRLNLRQLLIGCMTFATVANLGYLFYSSVGRARMIESFNGFGYTLAELALMDLAIRATPAGSEGLGFSIMMSVRNLALFGTDWIGSKMMDAFHVQFNSLVLSNAATTLITVPLVLLLPRMIVGHRDAELYEEPAAPVKSPQ